MAGEVLNSSASINIPIADESKLVLLTFRWGSLESATNLSPMFVVLVPPKFHPNNLGDIYTPMMSGWASSVSAPGGFALVSVISYVNKILKVEIQWNSVGAEGLPLEAQYSFFDYPDS